MTFREYLFYNNIKIAEMALKLNITRSYLNSMTSGRLVYSKKVSKAIEIVTGGDIKAKDIEGTYERQNLRIEKTSLRNLFNLLD